MPNNVEDGGTHKYQRQWEAFRWRRSWLGVFAAIFPFVILVATVEKDLFSTNNAALPAFLLWGALNVFTAFRLRRFPCPRCGKNFYFGLFDRPRNVLGRRCANCGLQRYAEE
jgi:hypothetical protein